MVATADEASGPRSVGFVHEIAANQSPAKTARHVFQVPHLQIRDRQLKLYTMDRELSEWIVASWGACNEAELSDIDRQLRDCLETRTGPNHWYNGLDTGRWIRKTMIRDWVSERKQWKLFYVYIYRALNGQRRMLVDTWKLKLAIT
jgi:hypothetical protein